MFKTVGDTDSSIENSDLMAVVPTAASTLSRLPVSYFFLISIYFFSGIVITAISCLDLMRGFFFLAPIYSGCFLFGNGMTAAFFSSLTISGDLVLS